jgi:hypothetical protein
MTNDYNKYHRGATIGDDGEILFYYCQEGECRDSNMKQFGRSEYLGKHLNRMHCIGLIQYWKDGKREFDKEEEEYRKIENEEDLKRLLIEAKRRSEKTFAISIQGMRIIYLF